VIGRLPGERSCLSLVWAVRDRASRGWRGVVMTPVAVRLLQDLRRQLFNPSPPEEGVVDQAVAPAAQHAASGACVPELFTSGTPPIVPGARPVCLEISSPYRRVSGSWLRSLGLPMPGLSSSLLGHTGNLRRGAKNCKMPEVHTSRRTHK
jgi:hypothetical protein